MIDLLLVILLVMLPGGLWGLLVAMAAIKLAGGK